MTTGAHDFDFAFGHWTVRHRRLRQRLTHSQDWDAFDGTCHTQPVMAGLGNVEDNVLDLPTGAYRAVALRSFDVASQTWAIWWLDGRTPHALDVPVVGRFVDGVGTFLADDTFEGKPVRVRFIWRPMTATRCHWEQAFSTDGGQSWETNWEMDFTRAG